MTRHKKGRFRALFLGWTAVTLLMLVTCLITGRNTMDEVWYTARQIRVLLFLSSVVLRKLELMPGSDLLRRLQVSVASFQRMYPW